MRKALITGITGQDGSYLAELLLEKGYEVHGVMRRASTFNTSRVNHLYQDPHIEGVRFFLHYGDLADANTVRKLIYKIRPDEIYNLGAQSHVRVSFDIPEYTANITGLGVLRILEAIKDYEHETGAKVKFYQASSSELFGDALPPQSELTPFQPRSPYGIAKLFAFHTVKNYREAYGIFAVNGILFNHECLTAQTPVLIRKKDIINIVPIEEIVPHRENSRHGIKYTTIGSGELEVWDGDKWAKVKALTATWNKARSGKDKLVKRVVCRGGYYEATADHVSFLRGKKEIQTSKLKPGDQLELKTFPPLNQKIVLTEEEAEFLGMMAADGYVSKDGKGRFINNDRVLRKRVQKLWQQIAGGFSREDKHPSGFNDKKMVGSIEFAGNSDYLRFIWKELYTQKLFKRIPKRILNAGPSTCVAFLRGYNLCDGLKSGHQKTEFKSFTTNSPTMALGLWYLVSHTLGLRITLHPEFRENHIYFHLNLNSNHGTQKGSHLIRDIAEIKTVKDYPYTGWLFDLETEGGTFSAGVGLTWVHNSPRRGETFVTRKITKGIADIVAGRADKIYLGNLDARRDWGYAPEFVEAMWRMLQQPEPEDFVIGTGEAHTVREFCEFGFRHAGIEDWRTHVGIDHRYFRPTEVDHLRADPRKAKEKLGWEAKVKFPELVKIMVDAEMKSYGFDR